MRVAVVGGTGYVGLTAAVCLSVKGHFVYCVGRNEEKMNKIRQGFPVIYEPNLKRMLERVLSKERLMATTDLNEAVQGSEVSFICVGTPCSHDGSIDLRQIQNSAKQVGYALRDSADYHVVAVKSTVVPGTTEDVVLPLLETFSGRKIGVDFGICMNPEFLREGRAVHDFMFPKETGVVIGEFDRKSGDVVSKVYEDFECEIMRTSIRAAEMIKYARNSYLAKEVSFANEIANICQRLSVDYLDVKKGMEMDSRIGRGRFLNAGAGFGGSCFPKDVRALAARARQVGIKPRMLEATLTTNSSQPYMVVELVKKALGNLAGKRIAVLGLAFKPGTDDVRAAPSLEIISALLGELAVVSVYDPKAASNTRKILGKKVAYAPKPEDALKCADACVIVTEWAEFADPKMYGCMRGNIIVDARRVLDPDSLPDGFCYFGIGFSRA